MNLTDTEAEQRTISGMLHSENACVEAISNLEDKDFSDPFNLKVFLVIKDLYTANVKPTLPEVLKEGLKSGLIASPQASGQLTAITERFINDENIHYWIEQVKTKSKMRYLDTMLDKYKATLKAAKDTDSEQILKQASEEFSALSILKPDEDFQEPGEVARLGYDLVVSKMERYREAKNANPYGALILDGVPTGIETLDAITLGYKPGDLVILAAKTGDGKTSFALNTVEAVSVRAKQPCLYVNTEMSKQQIALRWGCILSGVDHDKIRNGAITNEDLSLITDAYGRLTESGFYPATIPDLTPTKLQSITRKAKIRKDIQLLIIDYIGRMDKIDPRLQEWQILEQIVKSCKLLAQSLQIAVMILVQLNFDGSLQGAKRMKNEADLMLKLLPVTEEDRQAVAEKGIKYEQWNYYLEIEKNRDGIAGKRIPIWFDMPVQRIRQAVRIQQPSKANWEGIAKEVKR